ncbi:hypothetical protein TVAG_094210 [Trichomonas vaginalis G3]|uniref:Uncharacterized protein n=1 Tax=Trichomonas vaginalis (strain ATCC PRA-98 / G3) TaxID=412133 RepID=A2DBP3_TRIV3|nr:armadillo (ARM) repeat-containing protein family [Trichomonas vaginalis G3]EAY22246.1 hypothetical protein TVAG_094210 [Trichomonas vaginalis G3]KAI5533283.1 armadillo (ARM) repeat-containing protein family [Trichomonas vaginalis G3]|eukprot:XP_001583232.1 hypothetical protein [Trichomonas vaginalis G3]
MNDYKEKKEDSQTNSLASISNVCDEEDEIFAKISNVANKIQEIANLQTQLEENSDNQSFCEKIHNELMYISSILKGLWEDLQSIFSKDLITSYNEEKKLELAQFLIDLILNSDSENRLNALICISCLLQQKSTFAKIFIDLNIVDGYIHFISNEDISSQEFSILLHSLAVLISFSKKIYTDFIVGNLPITYFHERTLDFTDEISFKSLVYYSSVISSYETDPSQILEILDIFSTAIRLNITETFGDIISHLPQMIRTWPDNLDLNILMDYNIYFLISVIIDGNLNIPNISSQILYALDSVYYLLSRDIIPEFDWLEIKDFIYNINQDHRRSALNVLWMLCTKSPKIVLDIIPVEEFPEIFQILSNDCPSLTKSVFSLFVYNYLLIISPQQIANLVLEIEDFLSFFVDSLGSKNEIISILNIIMMVLESYDSLPIDQRAAFLDIVRSCDNWDELEELLESETEMVAQLAQNLNSKFHEFID